MEDTCEVCGTREIASVENSRASDVRCPECDGKHLDSLWGMSSEELRINRGGAYYDAKS